MTLNSIDRKKYDVFVSGIYKIVNERDGKTYVGSATHIYRRSRRHICDLKVRIHTNQKLQRAFDKYGESSFQFFVLEVVENKLELAAREQFWIDSLGVCGDGGYNILPTAYSGAGVKRSKEVCEKIRISKIGLKHTPEAKEKMRNAKLGQKHSSETIAKRSASNMGKKMSAECIRKRIATNEKKFSIYGSPGIRYKKKQGNWTARIRRNGVEKHLGTFATLEMALAARKAFIDQNGFL